MNTQITQPYRYHAVFSLFGVNFLKENLAIWSTK